MAHFHPIQYTSTKEQYEVSGRQVSAYVVMASREMGAVDVNERKRRADLGMTEERPKCSIPAYSL